MLEHSFDFWKRAGNGPVALRPMTLEKVGNHVLKQVSTLGGLLFGNPFLRRAVSDLTLDKQISTGNIWVQTGVL